MPEQPQFEAEAVLYGPKDERPAWAEGHLSVARDGAPVVSLDLTRNGGESILEALHGALYPGALRNVRRAIEAELDAVAERLRTKVAGPDEKGQAQGLAFALAVLINPGAPDVPAVKRAVKERAGLISGDVEVTDPQTLWLLGQGMLDLWDLADRITLKGYRKMGKADLVASLDQFDLDRYRLPEQAEEPDGDDVLFG